MNAMLAGLFCAALLGAYARAALAGDTDAAGRADRGFAANLYQQLAGASAGKNLFMSPYSISSALLMVAEGARGRTLDEMGKVLQVPAVNGTPDMAALHDGMVALNHELNGPAEEVGWPFELVVANALWPERSFPIEQTYTATIQKYYGGAGLFPQDFTGDAEAARQHINSWVADQTKQKIKDLVPQGAVGRDTKLVLTNAIYFKAAWQTPFAKAATSDQAFHLDGTHDVQAPLMRGGRDFFARYLETDALQMVALPYKGGEGQASTLSMLVILPKKVEGLAEVEKSLTAENLAKWSGALQRQPVQVFLPRFTTTGAFELSPTLEGMGMKLAFDSRADFSGICGSSQGQGVYISAVLHKAFVEVDEEGTEAAAATGVMMARAMALPGNPAVFRADHPFVFLIRHDPSGSILFMGRMANPKE